MHAIPIENAFAAGLAAHGITASFGDVKHPQDSDLAVFWGHSWQAIIDHQKKNGAAYLTMECGFIGDRIRQWFSMGFNGLNGRANFRNAGSPPDRLHRYHPHIIKPWRKRVGYVLILGQVPGDQSVKGVDLYEFYNAAAAAYRESASVVYRPHPNDPKNFILPGANQSSGTLADALDGARLAITFNSNAGVLAALHGVPVVTIDQGAMAWPVAGHKLGGGGRVVDREGWAADLAYSQWSVQEIESGVAWQHLSG